MHASKATLLALALPFALLTACGDDGTEDTGAQPTTTDNDSTTTDGPTTVEPADTSTTDEPADTSTTDEPTTDPDTTTGEPVENAEIRVLHLGVGAPAVDVFANGTGPVFEGLEFRNSTAYAPVPADEYTFVVTAAGDPVEEPVITTDPLTLAAETAYTAVAIGNIAEEGETGLRVIALVDDSAGIEPANVRIQVVHAAPAVGDVDIWEISGDEPLALLTDVPYGGFDTLADIPAGPLEIGIDVDNDANPDLTFSVDATPLAGQQINVYANNDAAGDVVLLAQLADGTVLPVEPN